LLGTNIGRRRYLSKVVQFMNREELRVYELVGRCTYVVRGVNITRVVGAVLNKTGRVGVVGVI